MKVFIVLTILPLVAYTLPATSSGKQSLDPVDAKGLDAIELEEDDAARAKRSGFDGLNQIKQGLVSTIGGASSQLISGSSSKSSGSSSSGHGGDSGSFTKNGIKQILLSKATSLSGASSSALSSSSSSLGALKTNLLSQITQLSGSSASSLSGKSSGSTSSSGTSSSGFKHVFALSAPLGAALSAPFAGHLSGSSSGSTVQTYQEPTYTEETTDHTGYGESGHSAGGFDAYKLKRDIVNTLMQAVKAITGGLVGLSGQFVKGSGYVVSAGGKLISASGDKVTQVGQTVAKTAHLVPAKGDGGHAAIIASLSSGLSKGSSGIAGSIASLSGSSSSHLSGSSSSSGGKGGSDSGHGGFTSFESQPSYGSSDSSSYDAPDTQYGPPSYGHGAGHYHHHEPIYLTTGPSTSDLYYPAASQKTKSVHQAANVLRNLINKLPDKDLKQHLTDYASQEEAIRFSVQDQPPFKTLPATINSLSHTDSSYHSDSVPPPPDADPEAYKVYRAMAAKLAGVKPINIHKKPYLILGSEKIVAPTPVAPFESAYPPSNNHHNSHHNTHSQQPHSRPNSNFEIQKTIQFAFHDPPQVIIHRRQRTVPDSGKP